MSKRIFSDSEIKILSGNPNVTKISRLSINFNFRFKEHVVLACASLQECIEYFEECGLEVNIIGIDRISQNYYRWKRQFKTQGNVPFILEGRGRKRKVDISKTDKFKKLSLEEQNKILIEERAKLEEEVHILKKYMSSMDGLKVKQDVDS